MDWKLGYRTALDAVPGRLHFAAHSHHPWLDVTRDAAMAAWHDAASLLDDKWEKIFGEVFPKARMHVARRLGRRDEQSLALAPNTHELVVRLLSCVIPGRRLKVVTTDGEFHSLRRQLRRAAEAADVDVEWVPVEPHEDFPERFAATIARVRPNFVFTSHVFFQTGYRVPRFDAILEAAPKDAIVVVDGYHAFCAIPVDWSKHGERAFYLGGGYKYAQAGEGACFLHVPPGTTLRPWSTGWWADFAHLADADTGGEVAYGPGGERFQGATFDPTAWYRWNAVADWWDTRGVTVARIWERVRDRQEKFLAAADGQARFPFSHATLASPKSPDDRGHFLAFDCGSPGAAAEWVRGLAGEKVVSDRRGRYLRLGFGVYQDDEDLAELVARIARLAHR
jgi:selenocysteine lyase/cysteine desulfurase